ncbi:uncharacterized protein LOC121972843 [Zingiber officinale]|uniref:uncharacterized protein LOC121972843 n=1 Tax=Zingiber officinale TaxID=94328 RepID=UPI001C4C1DFD|nr:uncharacterized protein LOC121972843 [Zingiber officinale]
MLQGTNMASTSTLKTRCFSFALLLFSITFVKSDDSTVGIVAKAMACFDNNVVYSNCQESYRLSAAGTFNVPLEATDDFCGGPCLYETKLLLSCVDHILYNFRFYNGASVGVVKYTLDEGCGHTSKRGDFNVAEHLGENPFSYGYGNGYGYGHANKIAVPIYLLILFSVLLLM